MGLLLLQLVVAVLPGMALLLGHKVVCLLETVLLREVAREQLLGQRQQNEKQTVGSGMIAESLAMGRCCIPVTMTLGS